jgi:hypothetical protein
MDTHEFDRTVFGLRVTFLRVLASVRSMIRGHRLYSTSDNKLTIGLEKEKVSTTGSARAGSAYVTQSNHIWCICEII